MKRLNTSPISGMQEFLPATQAVFEQFKTQIAEVYHSHGFLKIETPTIDRTEILCAKAGGDTEKQIYKVYKTAETADSADQALRFDHTVPLARYVVEHMNELDFPFRVTQIGKNFRGERAQKGRFREFYQCDVDIIGRGTLPLMYDAEIIATYIDALNRINIPSAVVRINNRKILSGFINSLALSPLEKEILGIIDHAEKVPLEATFDSLKSLNIGDDDIEKIMEFINISGTSEEAARKLEDFDFGDEVYAEGVKELIEILKALETQGYKNIAIADMMIVRGLDYYTGTVFEAFFKDYKEIGAIGGGGRYEALASHFTDQAFPGVGGSIGLSRLFYILQEHKLLAERTEAPVDYCLIPMSEKEYAEAFCLAKKLRKKNFAVDIVFSGKRIGDKLSHAGKIGKFGIVIGEDEVKTGKFQVKNLTTGEKTILEI